MRGDTLAHDDANQLGQSIGKVEGDWLISEVGRKIMQVEDSGTEAKTTVAAGYFFYLN